MILLIAWAIILIVSLWLLQRYKRAKKKLEHDPVEWHVWQVLHGSLKGIVSMTILLLLGAATFYFMALLLLFPRIDEVYISTDTRPLEEVREHVPITRKDPVYLQYYTANKEAQPNEYAIKLKGKEQLLPIKYTEIVYTAGKPKLYIRITRFNDALINKLLGLSRRVQSEEYKVFLPPTGVDIGTTRIANKTHSLPIPDIDE